MKAYEGMYVEIHVFLTSALVGGEGSASRPGRFTPGERVPRVLWKEVWVGPKGGLGDTDKRKFLNEPGLELQPLGDTLNISPPKMRIQAKNNIFCDITPFNPLEVNRRFGRTCRLHLQRRRITQVCKNNFIFSCMEYFW
jgi:hypothetical protein